MFGLLSILKSIADEFEYATVSDFEKMKVYFIHAAGVEIKLWSMSFGESMFHLWKEDELEIKHEFANKEEFLQQAIMFFWNFKYQIGNSLDELKNLSASHQQNMRQARSSTMPLPLLSNIVNPSIVRLTEKDHCKGMAKNGPFYSPEHN